MSETRKLAAILVTDVVGYSVVGYSRLAGADEDRTLARLRGLRSDLIDPAIAAHHGRIVKRTGDDSLIELPKRDRRRAMRRREPEGHGRAQRWRCRQIVKSSFAPAFISATLPRRRTAISCCHVAAERLQAG